MGPVDLPKLYVSDHAEKVKAKLEDLLHGMGLTDISVNYSLSSQNVDVDFDLQKDKKKEIEKYINEQGAALFH
jgi:copper chaperone CopZ